MTLRTRRERTMVFGGLIAVILILLWGWLTPSVGGGGGQKLLPLAKAEEKRVLAERAIQHLTTEQAVMTKRIDAATYDLPADQVAPIVIGDLQQTAARAGVHLTETKPLRAVPLKTSSLIQIPISVRFRAPFQPNVVQFLYYVEAPDSKEVVDKLTVGAPETKSSDVDVSAEISVYTRAQSAANPMEVSQNGQ